MRVFERNHIRRAFALSVVLVFLTVFSAFAQGKADDPRLGMLRDADHYELRLKPVKTLMDWENRKKVVRETLLLRSGLWPMPEKTPLNAKVFDERRGDGFTVSKVYYESLPGFFATGNLYRPSGGDGPFPAVITPHGHWQYGRLQNSERGSIPGRCIDFARMGFVVFSIDMVGYNDSIQLPHDPNKSRAQLKADAPLPYEHRLHRGDFDYPVADLYGFNLGGLQVWNAIRGVDFLTSLPYVDASRIGATGASGGASQTIFLMIADERIKVAAPVNIIGAAKHPGCRCENMPGLWLDTSTVELAAAFSPKPLLLMSATEDPWTNSTPSREYPLIRKYYALYNAEDKVRNVHITAGHNYNAETRAAVYDWFSKHLNSPNPPITDPPPVAPKLKSLGDLRVFPDHILPENAVTGLKVIDNWKTASEKAYSAAVPQAARDVEQFAETYGRMLRFAVAYYFPQFRMVLQQTSKKAVGDLELRSASIGWEGKAETFVPVDILAPKNVTAGNVVMVYPHDDGGLFVPGTSDRRPWVDELLKKGHRIIRIRGYASGESSIPQKTYDSFSWSSTYNPGNELYRIHDIITTVNYIASAYESEPLTVVGLKECGLPAAFACAVSGSADRVIVDMNGCDPGYDREMVRLLPAGGIRRVGDFRTAMVLLMRKPVTLLNTGATFERTWYRDIARKTNLLNNLDMRPSDTAESFVSLF